MLYQVLAFFCCCFGGNGYQVDESATDVAKKVIDVLNAEFLEEFLVLGALPIRWPKEKFSFPYMGVENFFQRLFSLEKRKVLGKGAFGVVKRLGRYAVKSMLSLEAQASFLNEMDVMGALNHPNILKITSAFIVDGMISLVFPLYAPLPSKNTITIFRALIDISKALEYMHQMLYVHGDVKPWNILVDASGSGILADFGLTTYGLHRYSWRYSWAYTEGYRAPEVEFICRYNESADVYALGKTLEDWAVVAYNPPNQYFTDFVARMTEHNPADRPSIETVVDELLMVQSRVH